MSIRSELADAIRDHQDLPKGWTVYDYPQPLTNPSKPVVVVRQLRFRRNPGAPRIYRDTDFQIALLVPETDPKKAEDAVDEASEILYDILEALDFTGLVPGEAERALFDEKFHGYNITATVTNHKE